MACFPKWVNFNSKMALHCDDDREYLSSVFFEMQQKHDHDHEHQAAAIAMPPQCNRTDRGRSHPKRTQPGLQVVLDNWAMVRASHT